ncbi:MAG TPA: hypothetical protein VJJ23_04090 [Candidatus Nanoarchaeia archaeon]|nr:hypothetical protein [Candidatus Nanoarchaeia archaeon]
MKSDELKTLKDEIKELKIKLEKISKEKEEWFKKKEDLKITISNKIKEIKVIKSSKDKSNIISQNIKNNKYQLKKEIEDLIKKAKQLNKTKKEIIQKLHLDFDPSELKNKLESLEMKIQTDAVSFETEKKMMKQVNELKKKLRESVSISKIIDEQNTLSKQIEAKRKQFRELIFKIRDHKSQDDYEDFFKSSKEIEIIKKEQEAAFNNFIEKKKEYSIIIAQIKDKINKIRTIDEKEHDIRREKLKQKKDEDQAILKQKFRNVEEKLKNKQKLTTEDLMIYQKTNS